MDRGTRVLQHLKVLATLSPQITEIKVSGPSHLQTQKCSTAEMWKPIKMTNSLRGDRPISLADKVCLWLQRSCLFSADIYTKGCTFWLLLAVGTGSVPHLAADTRSLANKHIAIGSHYKFPGHRIPNAKTQYMRERGNSCAEMVGGTKDHSCVRWEIAVRNGQIATNRQKNITMLSGW